MISEETRRKMRDAKLKNPTNYWLGKKRLHMTGKNNWKWRGDKVGYMALHSWVTRQLGDPKECEECGSKTAKKYEWANISKEYKRDLQDWKRLCSKCHFAFDGNQIGERAKTIKRRQEQKQNAYLRQRDSGGRFLPGGITL